VRGSRPSQGQLQLYGATYSAEEQRCGAEISRRF